MTTFEYDCILSVISNIKLFDINIVKIIETYIYQKCKNECKDNDGIEYIEEYVNRYEEKVGDYKAYYKESRKLFKTGFYIDNKMEGKCITYYENGNYKDISNFKNDLETGLGLGFTENGIIYCKAYYKDDKPNGLAKFWFYNDLKYHETYYVDGVVEEQYVYELIPYSNKRRRYKKGRLLIHDIYGKNQSRIIFEGITKTVYPYADGMINGVVKKYEILENNNPVFLSESMYINGQQNGYYREYFSYGRLKKEYKIKNGLPEGNYIQWDENGNIICTGVFKNGLREGLIDITYPDHYLLYIYREDEILKEKTLYRTNFTSILFYILFKCYFIIISKFI